MSETLEQIVLRVAQETDDAVGSYPGTKWLYEYSRRLVAALGAQEPVAQVDMNKASCVRWLNSTDPDTFHGTKLYTAPQLPQREGWQMVPKEPTVAMLRAAVAARHHSVITMNPIYQAMLAAAPKL